MFNNFMIYMKHGFGIHKAFRLAFGYTLKDTLLKCLYVLVTVLVLSFMVLSLFSFMDEQKKEKEANQLGYIKSLETIVALCLSDSTGKPVVIGDKTYLCGIYSIGI